MHWIYLICFTLLSAGLLALFQVRPQDFTDVIFNTGRKTATLSDNILSMPAHQWNRINQVAA